MKAQILSTIFLGLQFLGSSFAKPLPETSVVQARDIINFKPYVWNHFNAPVRYVGVVELLDEAFVFNYTAGAAGFEAYLDDAGAIKRASDNATLQVVPTSDPNIFTPTFDTSVQDGLAGTWSYEWLQCGQCNGRGIYFEPSAIDMPVLFILTPRSDVQGSWNVVLLNNTAGYAAMPDGSYYGITVLMD